MGEKNCDAPPLKNAAMGAKRPDSLPLNAAVTKLWQKPPISPSLRRDSTTGRARLTPAPEQTPPLPTAKAKVTTCLQVTPSPATPGGSGGGAHQRSFTSVNLTLRPPSSEPQPPIEITSANASLTYSTSSFDIEKGLESRLQITVSPTGGSVASFRRRRPRPLSCHDDTSEGIPSGSAVHHSMPDLSLPPSPTVQRQQAKIDRLKIELKAERNKLAAMQQEVLRLEQQESTANEDAVNEQLEKQLLREILHLRRQCENLSIEVDQGVEQQRRDAEFYSNIYVGQRHPPNFGRPSSASTDTSGSGDTGGWSCPSCTFHNHPSMGKCEQCDMPHILHGILAAQLKALSTPLNLPKIA